VGEGLVGVLGGVDLPEALGEGGGFGVAAGLVVGGGGGQVGGEQAGGRVPASATVLPKAFMLPALYVYAALSLASRWSARAAHQV
jgi:hypothetical protein